jgi:hypothetical protein
VLVVLDVLVVLFGLVVSFVLVVLVGLLFGVLVCCVCVCDVCGGCCDARTWMCVSMCKAS